MKHLKEENRSNFPIIKIQARKRSKKAECQIRRTPKEI